METEEGSAATEKRVLSPLYWGLLFFILAQTLTFLAVSRLNPFLEGNDIYIPPQTSPEVITWWPTADEPPWTALGPILIYFFAVIVILGVTLFLVPVSTLKLFLRALYALIFTWGLFIVLVLWAPFPAAIAVSAAAGLVWLLTPRVWLHDLVMVVTMVSLGTVFGRIIPAWTAMILLSVLAIYDLLAVRFGYMMWMANRLSGTASLPAFVIPRTAPDWNSNLRSMLAEEKPAGRDYSILGGGDIGFALLLTSSVYFGYGFTSAILVSAFSAAGLAGAYLIQSTFLRGKPVPALPPIAAMALIGLLIVH